MQYRHQLARIGLNELHLQHAFVVMHMQHRDKDMDPIALFVFLFNTTFRPVHQAIDLYLCNPATVIRHDS